MFVEERAVFVEERAVFVEERAVRSPVGAAVVAMSELLPWRDSRKPNLIDLRWQSLHWLRLRTTLSRY
jgi:hypothetical protein